MCNAENDHRRQKETPCTWRGLLSVAAITITNMSHLIISCQYEWGFGVFVWIGKVSAPRITHSHTRDHTRQTNPNRCECNNNNLTWFVVKLMMCDTVFRGMQNNNQNQTYSLLACRCCANACNVWSVFYFINWVFGNCLTRARRSPTHKSTTMSGVDDGSLITWHDIQRLVYIIMKWFWQIIWR